MGVGGGVGFQTRNSSDVSYIISASGDEVFDCVVCMIVYCLLTCIPNLLLLLHFENFTSKREEFSSYFHRATK